MYITGTLGRGKRRPPYIFNISTLRESISRGYPFFFVRKGHKYFFILYYLYTLVYSNLSVV